jgi:autotransporter-associated beta strand protein
MQPRKSIHQTTMQSSRSKNRIRPTAAALAGAALALTLPAGAEPVTVPNPGFEARGTYDPLPDAWDQFHRYGQESWRQWQRTSNGGPCRIWNPGAPGSSPQTTGTINVGFGGTAAEGDYIMVVRSSQSDGANFSDTGEVRYYFEALSQILTETFDHTRTYLLTVKVGRPPGSDYYVANWLGYGVLLAVGGTNVGGSQYAGSVTGGTVIEEDMNSLTVPVDGWVTATVRYTPNPADAGLDGQPLQIRLCSLDDPLNLAASGIVAFDDVKLEAYVIPEGDVTPPTLTGADFADDAPRPPLFSEAFDAAAALPAGWTSSGPSNGTQWEVGQPTGATSGPTAAASPLNCAGTNIAGIYTASTDVRLATPPIAIPADSAATLSFQQFIDTDLSADFGSVRILDADNSDTPITGLEIIGIQGVSAGWTLQTLEMAADKVGGKNIKVEFRFVSNEDDHWAGFYVDDVKVTEANPGGGPVIVGTKVTYTVTFSEPMEASSVLAAGFTNAGSAASTIRSITHLGNGVFEVQLTPTSAGTLLLQVPVGAVMKDPSGNALNTGSAIIDDTEITVQPGAGNDSAWIVNDSGDWSNANRWAGGVVPFGTDRSAEFTANITAIRTANVDTPRTIGHLTFTDSTTPSHDFWLAGNGPFTLDVSSGSPVIDVTQSGRTLHFSNPPLAGNDGLTKEGPGNLRLALKGQISGTTTVNGGTLDISLGASTHPYDIALAADTTLSYALDERRQLSTQTLSGVISGEGKLTKGGRSGLFLSNDNTYTGVTTISDGALILLSAQALPGGIGTTGGISPLTFNGGVLGLGAGDFTRSLAAAGTPTGATFSNNGGWAAYGADRTVNLGGAAQTIEWGTADTGFGGRTLKLGSTRSTTFTTVQAAFPSTHKVTLVNPLDLGAVVRTVSVDDGLAEVDAELSGVLSGDGGLTKTNGGTLVLSADNSYLGATTVSAGKLLINGNQSAATGAVAVNGTSILGGSGTSGGNVTLAAGASLAPGTSAGTLSILGDLDISALAGGAGKLNFELASPAASDRVAVTGLLLIGDAVLGFTDFVFTDLGGLQEGTYKLITSGGITGSLDPADLSGVIGAFTGTLQITGNDLELVVATGGASPYQIWSGGAAFDADANGDGVANGLAWLLGAAGPAANATGLLPEPTRDAGDLVLDFRCLASAGRGTALLKVQFSNDLGQADPWASHEALVPNASGTVGGVAFTITPDADPAFIQVLARIPASAASADGELFGRLAAQE